MFGREIGSVVAGNGGLFRESASEIQSSKNLYFRVSGNTA